jgi:hypothetical protein
MADVIVQATVGRCGILDVLEEAAVWRTRVSVGLADGSELHDIVTDVVTSGGSDRAVFSGGASIPLESIVWMTRAQRPTAR